VFFGGVRYNGGNELEVVGTVRGDCLVFVSGKSQNLDVRVA